MKFDQSTECNKKYFSSTVMQKMRQRDKFQASLFFKKALSEVKASGLRFTFNIFR